MAVAMGCSGSFFEYRSVSAESKNQHFETKPIYIDKSFSKEDLATINLVVAEWNYALNGYMVWKIEPVAIDHNDKIAMGRLSKQIRQTHEGIVMLGLDHDDELVEDTIDEYDGTLAFVNNLGDRAHYMVVVRDRMGYKNIHKILLHEFGHAMGADHVMTESLMFPYYGHQQRDCVDKITAAQVATYHELKLAHMNYCATPNFE